MGGVYAFVDCQHLDAGNVSKSTIAQQSTNAQKAIHKCTASDPQMHAAIYKYTGRDSQMNVRQSCVCDVRRCL